MAKTTMTYNGKEREQRHHLVDSDFGARTYNAARATFAQPDPLAEKYYPITPYAYCAADPINHIDPSGKIIVAVNEDAQRAIINMLPVSQQSGISFDESGIMSMQYVDNFYENASIYNDLRTVNLHPEYVFVEVSPGFHFLLDGVVKYQEFSLDERENEGRIYSVNDLCTGEVGYIGSTLFPNGRYKQTVDAKFRVVVNSNLTLDGQSQSLGHELLGHIYLYFQTNDYDSATHNYVGNRDANFVLVARIIGVVNLIYENQKDD